MSTLHNEQPLAINSILAGGGCGGFANRVSVRPVDSFPEEGTGEGEKLVIGSSHNEAFPARGGRRKRVESLNKAFRRQHTSKEDNAIQTRTQR